MASVRRIVLARCSSSLYERMSQRHCCALQCFPHVSIRKETKKHFSLDSVVISVAQSRPVGLVQEALQTLHDSSCLPWWATVMVATFAARSIVTFPLTAFQHYVLARYANLQPEIKQLATQLKKEVATAIKMYNWSENVAKRAYNRSLKKHITALIIRDNCHPLKASLVIWVQVPMWICISFALRNLVSIQQGSEVLFLQLSVGGALWFPDLTVVDSSLILPFTLGFLNLAIIEMHSLRATQISRFQTWATNVGRGISVLLIPIAAAVPLCISLYWTTSSFLGFVQNMILLSPRIRKLFKIPSVENESHTPFQDLVKRIKVKYGRKQSK